MTAKIEWYREVLELEPNSKVFFPLARLLAEDGQTEEAMTLLQRGVERHPEYLEARLFLIELLHKSDHRDECNAQVGQLSKMFASYAGFWQAWAACLASEQGQADTASIIRFLAAHFVSGPLNLHEVLNRGLDSILGTQQAVQVWNTPIKDHNSATARQMTAAAEFAANSDEMLEDLDAELGVAEECLEACQTEVAPEPETQVAECEQPVLAAELTEENLPIEEADTSAVAVAEPELAIGDADPVGDMLPEAEPEVLPAEKTLAENAPLAAMGAEQVAETARRAQPVAGAEAGAATSGMKEAEAALGAIDPEAEMLPAEEPVANAGEEQAATIAAEPAREMSVESAPETELELSVAEPEPNALPAEETAVVMEGPAEAPHAVEPDAESTPLVALDTEPELALGDGEIAEEMLPMEEPQAAVAEQSSMPEVEADIQAEMLNAGAPEPGATTADPVAEMLLAQDAESTHEATAKDAEAAIGGVDPVAEMVPDEETVGGMLPAEEVAGEAAPPEQSASEIAPVQEAVAMSDVAVACSAEADNAHGAEAAADLAEAASMPEQELSEQTAVEQGPVLEPDELARTAGVVESDLPEVEEAPQVAESANEPDHEAFAQPVTEPTPQPKPEPVAVQANNLFHPASFIAQGTAKQAPDIQAASSAQPAQAVKPAAQSTPAAPAQTASQALAAAPRKTAAEKAMQAEADLLAAMDLPQMDSAVAASSQDDFNEEEPFSLRTRSMAEVLAEQGDIQGALDIYQELAAAATSADEVEDINHRIATLSGRLKVANASAAFKVEEEEAAARSKAKLLGMLEALEEGMRARAQA